MIVNAELTIIKNTIAECWSRDLTLDETLTHVLERTELAQDTPILVNFIARMVDTLAFEYVLISQLQGFTQTIEITQPMRVMDGLRRWLCGCKT